MGSRCTGREARPPPLLLQKWAATHPAANTLAGSLQIRTSQFHSHPHFSLSSLPLFSNSSSSNPLHSTPLFPASLILRALLLPKSWPSKLASLKPHKTICNKIICNNISSHNNSKYNISNKQQMCSLSSRSSVKGILAKSSYLHRVKQIRIRTK